MTWSPMDAPGPMTVESLTADLRGLGVAAGSTLLVHSSLRSLGHVVGGAHAAVLALLAAVGPTGTLVVPTHSGDLSEPSEWQHPPAPEAQWPTIRAHLPAYDPHLTPTRGMGAIPDVVRRHPRARRSAHPQVSFAALGPNAAAVTDDHGLAVGFDERSPLARLEEFGASVLLLGVDHDRNTSLHLAEWRAHPPSVEAEQGAPLLVDGERQRVTYETIAWNADDFVACGRAFEASGGASIGTVGAATARLLNIAQLVAFAEAWFCTNRPGWDGAR